MAWSQFRSQFHARFTQTRLAALPTSRKQLEFDYEDIARMPWSEMKPYLDSNLNVLRTNYLTTISNRRAVVPKASFLILFYEDMKRDPWHFLDRL